MKRTAIGGVLLAAVLWAGCGEGRLIFNIDVFSFIRSNVDTVPYGAPPLTTLDTTTVPLEITALGLSDSVLTVDLIAGADFINATGSGTVSLQIFFAADSDSVYVIPATPQFNMTAVVTPGTTTLARDSIPLVDQRFNRQTLWVGLRVRAQNTSGAIMQGRMALNELRARVVIQDNVFGP